jgi:hypothetical protein
MDAAAGGGRHRPEAVEALACHFAEAGTEPAPSAGARDRLELALPLVTRVTFTGEQPAAVHDFLPMGNEFHAGQIARAQKLSTWPPVFFSATAIGAEPWRHATVHSCAENELLLADGTGEPVTRARTRAGLAGVTR